MVKKSDSITVLRIQIWICFGKPDPVQHKVKFESGSAALFERFRSRIHTPPTKGSSNSPWLPVIKFCVLCVGCGQPRCPRCYSPSVHHTLRHRYHARLQGDFSYHSGSWRYG
jgi:hypothetical protein